MAPATKPSRHLRPPLPRARVRPRRPLQHVTVTARHRGSHRCSCPSRRIQPTTAHSGRTSARRGLSTAPSPPFPTQVDLPRAVPSPGDRALPAGLREEARAAGAPLAGENISLPEPSSAAYKRGPTASPARRTSSPQNTQPSPPPSTNSAAPPPPSTATTPLSAADPFLRAAPALGEHWNQISSAASLFPPFPGHRRAQGRRRAPRRPSRAAPPPTLCSGSKGGGGGVEDGNLPRTPPVFPYCFKTEPPSYFPFIFPIKSLG
jgi:hypothetical protein